MHWSEEIAKKVIERNPNKEEYVCAAGISPSGSIHIGNFRDIATSYFVCKAIRKMGKKARLLFSWDEYDRLRKVPVNVDKIAPGMDKYIGMPYVDVPDPYGCCKSYAEHFEKEFEASLAKFGIEVDFRHQAEMYRSGAYADKVIESIKKRGEIFDILDSFRTQDAQEGEREAYYPVGIYCDKCGKDTTKIVSSSKDCTEADYVCECGHKGHVDFTKDFNCKLAWKIDWPMRWQYEGVDFEPGGKDHASPTGSYSTSKIISDKIFGFEAPVFQGYEFIGLKGLTGKMSGSSGLNLTPDTLLKLYQPEVILWLYSKSEPTKAFNFCFDDEILRQYFEFDKTLTDYYEGRSDEHWQAVMYNINVGDRKLSTVPMSQLATLGSIVDFNPELIERIFEKIGTGYKKEEFAERLELAKYWAEKCSPESLNKLLARRNWKYFDTLTDEEKKEIEILREYLAGKNYTLDELNTYIYAVPEQVLGTLEGKAKKEAQAKFFKNIYQLLLGKEKGPRLYLFLYSINLDDYIWLLDFSGEREEYEEEEEEVPVKKADPVEAEIDINGFATVDMRVCRILKCEEIPKGRTVYKLTLDDGLDGRVIVSSIKNDYKPEELEGKNIIVVANLKPAKLAGVVSEGMLLAATADECGCQVIFVDDSVPAGTRIK
ncbi:MAG: lysine--tRNA ligase [Christensenellaceae bacterium]|nr:lysine--tRNA ligase [Christensenellaceae bacterium]